LDAARILNAEDPGGWRFLAVGSGDGRAALLAEYADLIEAGAAAFPEAGAEVLSLVRDSRIGVLLTNPEFACEGVSNSVMEYMACALPVVATDLGGNREIVIEGETGMLVPAANVDELVRRLRLLRDDPGRAKRMGEAGRERVATAFTVAQLVAGTVEAYELAALRSGGKVTHWPRSDNA
jgi:glycosyltransferase involved in cell wall biosynthesis